MSPDSERLNALWEVAEAPSIHERRQLRSTTTRSRAKVATIRRSISGPIAQIILDGLYPHCPLSISDLTQGRICLCAQILRQPLMGHDQAVFQNRTRRLIQGLPKSLRNPSPLPQLSQTFVTDMFHFAGASKERPAGLNEALQPPQSDERPNRRVLYDSRRNARGAYFGRSSEPRCVFQSVYGDTVFDMRNRGSHGCPANPQ